MPDGAGPRRLPVTQELWAQVGSIGPDDSAKLPVNRGEGKESGVAKRLEHGAKYSGSTLTTRVRPSENVTSNTYGRGTRTLATVSIASPLYGIPRPAGLPLAA